MFGAFSTLFAMNAEEKNLLKVKQISDERTPDEWIKFFTSIASFDVQGDKARSWGCGIAIAGIVITFISFFLMALYIGFLTLPIGLIMLICGLIVYFYLKGYDVPGEKLSNGVVPILLILREDMNSKEKIKLRLDLRGFEIAEKKTGESQKYQKGVYHTCIDYYYRDHWMEGRATLADGTQLIWNLYDLARNTRKTKRNYRGKTKTKNKQKHRSFIALQAGMRKEMYSLQDGLKQKSQEGKIVINDTGKRSWVTIRKMIKHPYGKEFQPVDFINTVATAYKLASKGGTR